MRRLGISSGMKNLCFLKIFRHGRMDQCALTYIKGIKVLSLYQQFELMPTRCPKASEKL